ncbi:isocitrate dehydrogenase [NAD] subunit beta, mitochondrial isoform 1-T1 [Glossina fuscipes fuscipes]
MRAQTYTRTRKTQHKRLFLLIALSHRNSSISFSRAFPCIRGLQTSTIRSIHATATLNTDPGAHGGNRTTCTLIPGDGVGPELVQCLQEVFKSADVPVDFECYFLSEVNPVLSAKLEDVIASIRKNKVCIKGVLATPDYSNVGELQSLNMKLRNELDLYANVVHARSLPGVKTRYQDIDIVVIREQTEGEYSALEHESVPGIVECLKIITAKKSTRIAKFAFDYAIKNSRKKVTSVHKANIMKLGDGLFLKSCEDMAKLYPRIEFQKMIVDNTTMQIVSHPHQFDVLVTPNLYGSIIDNLFAGIVGGAGLVAGASYSPDTVVFEPGARHTFSEAVGKNVANPTAMFFCGTKLLRHINLPTYSEMITNAIIRVLSEGKVRTKDLGGYATTQEFTRAVIANIH